MSSMLLAAAAAAVVPTPTVTADQALINAQNLYAVPPPPKAKPCPVSTTNEIIVCRQLENPTGQYVPSDIDSGVPDDGGVPRAPTNITMMPQGGMVVMRGCFIPPCPPPPALIIDLKSIPEAPAGSDADKISKGEMAAP